MGKRIALIAVAVLVSLILFYLIAPGFTKEGNACITAFEVSEDGTEMKIAVSVGSSIGYVRRVSEHGYQNGRLELDCYSAFGGINGTWGAKSQYTVRLREDMRSIALWNAADNGYRTVLIKDGSGQWQFADWE